MTSPPLLQKFRYAVVWSLLWVVGNGAGLALAQQEAWPTGGSAPVVGSDTPTADRNSNWSWYGNGVLVRPKNNTIRPSQPSVGQGSPTTPPLWEQRPSQWDQPPVTRDQPLIFREQQPAYREQQPTYREQQPAYRDPQPYYREQAPSYREENAPPRERVPDYRLPYSSSYPEKGRPWAALPEFDRQREAPPPAGYGDGFNERNYRPPSSWQVPNQDGWRHSDYAPPSARGYQPPEGYTPYEDYRSFSTPYYDQREGNWGRPPPVSRGWDDYSNPALRDWRDPNMDGWRVPVPYSNRDNYPW